MGGKEGCDRELVKPEGRIEEKKIEPPNVLAPKEKW